MPTPTEKERAYICGPMRGHKYYNFPMFHEAAALLQRTFPDWLIDNPACEDEIAGFDPYDSGVTVTQEFLRSALLWDIEAITKANHIVLLPGWAASSGVSLELHALRVIGPVPNCLVYELTGDPLKLPGFGQSVSDFFERNDWCLVR